MKIVFFSDTHKKHEEVQFPEGDVLVFCGDMCGRGSLNEVESFAKFVSALDYEYKVIIAGNHDFPFEYDEEKQQAESIIMDSGCIYLNDSGCVINGFNFWGSPIQPTFMDWAFNRDEGEDIKKHWDLIPDEVDVLITHGPPYGVLDRIVFGKHVGCRDLLAKVLKIKPKVHAFGHIHEGYGQVKKYELDFINASSLNQKYEYVNPPIVFEINET